MGASALDRFGWPDARVRRRFITPQLISGIVVVSVVIAVADEAGGVSDVFAITILSVLIFWITDIFAQTIAAQRRRGDDQKVNLRGSLRFAVSASIGYLYAAILPSGFLILGLFGLRNGHVAYWVALWTQVGILAVVGWFAFGGSGILWWHRALGAIATAALGVLAIGLKILIH